MAESSKVVRESHSLSIRAQTRWRLFLVLHANPSLRAMRKGNMRLSEVLDEIDKPEDVYARSRAASTIKRRMSTAAAAPQLVVVTEKSSLLDRA